MSFTDLLRDARSSRVSTFHKFLTNYDPSTDRVFAFVEGEADEPFYRAQIQKYVPDQRLIYIYNCDGKKNVCDLYAEVVKKYPKCERVLFFLDKDVDDIVGAPWPADPRIFVTECYSIENYVVTLGRKGGKARLKTMTAKERSERARNAAQIRWNRDRVSRRAQSGKAFRWSDIARSDGKRLPDDLEEGLLSIYSGRPMD